EEAPRGGLLFLPQDLRTQLALLETCQVSENLAGLLYLGKSCIYNPGLVDIGQFVDSVRPA
ncbi:MAG: hypothetical protein KF893_17035, partial [Caldilineaceae bacterium]|nr:hypothetical protein [Caldilineaceae bacterium]